MLTIRHVTEGSARRVALDRLDEVLDTTDGFVWIDLSDPAPEEQDVLDRPAMGIDPLVREDIRDDAHLPKLDIFVDHLLLTLHPLEVETSTVALRTGELDVVLADRLLVTHHVPRIASVETVAEQLEADRAGRVELDRPAAVLHRILDVMAAVYLPFLELLGRRLALVEEDVVGHPVEATRDEIFALRRDLITMRRISVPQAEVVRALSRERSPVLDDEDRVLFRDVWDHLNRMAELSESYRQLAQSAYEMYRSVRDDQTTRRLTLLTMVSTLLLPITAVAGIYGMNFQFMPELDERWAYPAVLTVFAVIVVGGLALFRWWGWLGRPRQDEETRRRHRRVERLEIPGVGRALKVPAYGARFALARSRQVVRAGRRLGPGGRRRRRAP